MPVFHQGTVILIGFPFSDAVGIKKRPALVLLDTGDDDILVARITAQVRQDDFDCELKNWADAGLRVPSTVRLHKLATLKKTLVERTLGRLSSADADCICQTLSRMATALKAIP